MSRQSVRNRSLKLLGVPPGHRKKLAGHALDKVGAFASYCAQARGVRRISSFLGVGEVEAETWARRAREQCPELGSPATFAAQGMLALGCLAAELSDNSSIVEADPWKRIDLRTVPATVSRVRELDGPRDQGRLRGTCVAFALVAASEQVWRRVERHARDPEIRLSEQFLYWRCKEEDGHPGPGTYPREAAREVVETGICRRDTWPYDPEPGESEGQGPPPPRSTAEARRYRVGGVADLTSDRTSREMLDSIVGCLAGIERWPGRVVAIGMRLHESFLGADVETYGRVPVPLPGEQVVGHHEMVVVGYELGDEFPGGGVFLVRNSWGTGWARKCEIGGGHCLITFRHALEQVLFAHALLARSEIRSTTRHGRGRRVARPVGRFQAALTRYAGSRFPIVARRISERPVASMVLAAAAAATLLPEQLRQPIGLLLTSIMLVVLLLRVKVLRPHVLAATRHLREHAGMVATAVVRRMRSDVSPAIQARIMEWLGPSIGAGILLMAVWPGLVIPVAAISGIVLVVAACFGRVEGRAALIIGLLAALCTLSCAAQSLIPARFSLTLLSVGLLLGLTESFMARSALFEEHASGGPE